MRLITITLAAVAAALGTFFGLQQLYPAHEPSDIDPDIISPEQVFERPLAAAPLSSDRLLTRADDAPLTMATPEPLSEDMDSPIPTPQPDTAPDQSRERLTDEALRLAALAEEEVDIDEEVDAEDSRAAEDEDIAESAPVDVADPTPVATRAPSATPTPSEIPATRITPAPPSPPTATIQPSPTQVQAPNPTPETDAGPAVAQDSAPAGSSSMASAHPLDDRTIAASSHDIGGTPSPRTPRPATAATTAPRAAAQQPAIEPEAWWLRTITPEQLGVVHIGIAAFNRAIVLMTDGGFSSIDSLASNVEVLHRDSGIVVEGQWSISPANDHLLVFPLVDAGEYDIIVGAGLQDRDGRLWPHTVRGTLYVP